MSSKKMTIFTLLGIVVIIGVIVAYAALFTRPNPPLPQNKIQVGPATFTVELATSTVAQARGLSYRPNLPDGNGMLFIFGRPAVQSFWMKDMNFSLDMVWIGKPSADAPEQVLGFAENAAPQPGTALWNLKIYTSPGGTDQVLEVNAGTVAKEGIKVGDLVAESITAE